MHLSLSTNLAQVSSRKNSTRNLVTAIMKATHLPHYHQNQLHLREYYGAFEVLFSLPDMECLHRFDVVTSVRQV